MILRSLRWINVIESKRMVVNQVRVLKHVDLTGLVVDLRAEVL